jgi:DNA-binding CsgD family transcriptional regulator
MIRWFAGDFRGAIASWLESAAWNSGGHSCRRAWAAAIAAIAAGELGSLAEARHYVEHADLVYGHRAFYVWSQHADWAAAFLRWRSGDPTCLLGLRRAADAWLAIGARPNAAFALLDLAEAAAVLQQRDAAEAAARDLKDMADRVDRPFHHALADFGRACAELSAADAAAAAGHARRAADVFHASGYRAFHARALEVAGRALARQNRGAAAATIAEASGCFTDLGIGWRRDRCTDLLAQLGPSARRLARTPAQESLSAREADVARLAALGLTAREIGDRLFIGERTVETHLANVYVKLGLESKRELVLRAAEFGLADGTDSRLTKPNSVPGTEGP